MTDEIVAEVRKNREAYAAKHGFDLDRICRDLFKRQVRSGRRVVDLAAKRHLRSAARSCR